MVPTVVPSELASREEPCPVLLPHELASLIYSYNQDAFRDVMGLQDAETVVDYWERYLASTPEFSSHLMCEHIRRQPGQWVPCKLFEDDGGIGKHRAMSMSHWSPLLSRSATLDSTLPMFVLDHHTSLEYITSRPLIAACVWSWGILATGKWPTHDHTGKEFSGWRRRLAGNDLCGPFRFVVVHICMDWKASATAFHLPWSYCAVRPHVCHLCHATRSGPQSFARFDRHCQDPPRDTQAYLASPSGRASPWAWLPGFFLAMIGPVLTHAHALGICRYACGSLLLELCRAGWWGVSDDISTWAERLQMQLASAYLDFRQHCRSIGVRTKQKKFTVRRLSMHNKSDMPMLKTKAAMAFHVTDWLAHAALCKARADPTQYAKVRATMANGLSDFGKILRFGGKPFLLPDEKTRLRAARDSFFACYHTLRAMAVEQGQPLYPIAPKFHMVSHGEALAQRTGLNPAMIWTFQDEDAMGLAQLMCMSSHGATVPITFLDK